MANQLFSIDAKSVKKLREEGNDDIARELLNEILFKKYKFQIFSKIDVFMDNPVIRHQVYKIEEINSE